MYDTYRYMARWCWTKCHCCCVCVNKSEKLRLNNAHNNSHTQKSAAPSRCYSLHVSRNGTWTNLQYNAWELMTSEVGGGDSDREIVSFRACAQSGCQVEFDAKTCIGISPASIFRY